MRPAECLGESLDWRMNGENRRSGFDDLLRDATRERNARIPSGREFPSRRDRTAAPPEIACAGSFGMSFALTGWSLRSADRPRRMASSSGRLLSAICANVERVSSGPKRSMSGGWPWALPRVQQHDRSSESPAKVRAPVHRRVGTLGEVDRNENSSLGMTVSSQASARGFITTTGQSARRNTASDTLPIRNRPSPRRPCVPSTR